MHVLKLRATFAVASAILATFLLASVAFAGVGSGPWP
jgi:hypothetical protein